jgi:hypothetical protein
MKRYEPVFTGLAVVKVSIRLASYQHGVPPSWPHLDSLPLVGRLVSPKKLKVYPGFLHGRCSTNKNQIIVDLLAFIAGERSASV